MADMNIAVGIWRTIMENKLRAPGRLLPNLLVQLFRLPVIETLRFLLGQPSLHRKTGFGKIQSSLVIGHE